MKFQVVIRDAAIGEAADAGQHIYCRGCGHSVYDVAGCALAKCDKCDTWNRIGPVLVRPAERHAAGGLRTPAQKRAAQRMAVKR